MDLFERPARKGRGAYLPLFDDASLNEEPVGTEPVSQQDVDSVLQQVGSLTGGTVSRLGDALQMPGDYLRGVISGRAGERVTGRGMLRDAGLIGKGDTWGNFIAGLAIEAATDPLAVLSGPAKAITPAGKAAAKLNLLDTAPVAMTRKAISTGATDLPMVARRTKKALEATGRTLSTFDPAVVGRPLYGVRTARRAGTLDDLIKYADDTDAAEKAARDLLKGDLDSLRTQPLAKSVGIGLPFQDPSIAIDLFGKKFGDQYADVLDTIGQAYRWSPLGRASAAAFNPLVDGKLDPELQLTNIANARARTKAGGEAVAANVYDIAKLYEAHPEVFSEEGNRALGRYLEGPAARTADDVAYVESRPELLKYAQKWQDNRDLMLQQSREMGLNANMMTDKYGIEYLPRRADPALEMAAKRDRKLQNILSAFTGDMLGRTDAMQVPGGRDTIIDLSRDTMVSGSKRTLRTPDEAAQYIVDTLSPMVGPGQPAIDNKQAIRLARVLADLPDDIVQKSPLFGQHPTEMIGSYMRGRGEAMATAKTLYDSLATMAKNTPYTQVPGERHLSIPEALQRLGLKTHVDDLDDDVFEVFADKTTNSLSRVESGAASQMRDRMSKLLGVDPDQIRLSDISVPESHVERLLRSRDAFSGGELSSTLLDGLDWYTQAWKGSILAWPARAVRDLYSGAVSNWLEGALDTDAIGAVRALMSEGPSSQRFLRTLSQIPRYKSDDGMARFYADLAKTGLITGPSGLELGSAVVGKRALDPLIGADPVNLRSIGKELSQNWGVNNFLTWRSRLHPLRETMNPIMRAGEKMNSLTDGINRISGYVALLKKGFDPEAAAAAMKRVHVDYASLSSLERNVLKQIFPWYSYQSRIFREVLKQLIERPGGRYGQLLRGTEAYQDEANDQYVPGALRSQFAIPIPSALEGIVPGEPGPGVTRYLTDLDFPGFDQINMLATPGTASGSVFDTARQIAMQTHPFLRQGIELATNQDLFNRQPIGDSVSPLDSILRYATGDDTANVPAIVDKLVESAPFVARPLYVARALTDTRGGVPIESRAGKAAFNAVTGMKLRDVSERDRTQDARREIEGSIDPYTREFRQVYIPKALQTRVPQYVNQRLAVARSLGRDLRAQTEAQQRGKKKKSKTKSRSGIPHVSLFE